jgi:hypothetical protein
MEGSLVAYKIFTNGSTLQASEVNENLMQQSVATFSNAAARNAAIISPVEGQVTYLEDSGSYQYWDSSAWVGLVPQSANAIINGAFDINQRGFTSGTVGGTFPFDRWVTDATGDGTTTFSAQTFTPGAAPVAGYEGTNFLRLVTTGQTSSSVRSSFTQRIENVRTFAGETVTLSFFAKSGSGTPKLALEMFQNFGSGGSANVFLTGQQVTISSSWTRYSATFSVPSLSGKTIGANNNLSLNIFVSAGSDLNARTGSLGIQSNTFDIWGVQLEAGSVATPFRRNANSLQGELAACQRYFFRTRQYDISGVMGTGLQLSTTSSRIFAQYPVTMRVKPTSVEFINLEVSDLGTYNGVVSGIFIQNASTTFADLSVTHGSGGAQFRYAVLRATSASNSFLQLNAEL